MHGKKLAILLLFALLLSGLSACGDESEPTLRVSCGDASISVSGHASETSKTTWLGESYTQEVSFAEELEPVTIAAQDEALQLTFSAAPAQLQIQLTDSAGQVSELEFSSPDQNVFSVSVQPGDSCEITGSWEIGKSAYKMEFAEIKVE